MIGVKLEFHGTDTDTDTDIDILADFRARIVARMSACPVTSPFSLPRAGHACRHDDPRTFVRRALFLARILARMSVEYARVYTRASLTDILARKIARVGQVGEDLRACLARGE